MLKAALLWVSRWDQRRPPPAPAPLTSRRPSIPHPAAPFQAPALGSRISGTHCPGCGPSTPSPPPRELSQTVLRWPPVAPPARPPRGPSSPAHPPSLLLPHSSASCPVGPEIGGRGPCSLTPGQHWRAHDRAQSRCVGELTGEGA